MKKALALVMALSLMLSATGCAPDGDDASSSPSLSPSPSAPMSSAPQQTPEPSEETGSLEDLDGLDVEQNLFDVELTLPASFVEEGTTQESLDAGVSNGSYGSATLY